MYTKYIFSTACMSEVTSSTVIECGKDLFESYFKKVCLLFFFFFFHLNTHSARKQIVKGCLLLKTLSFICFVVSACIWFVGKKLVLLFSLCFRSIVPWIKKYGTNPATGEVNNKCSLSSQTGHFDVSPSGA